MSNFVNAHLQEIKCNKRPFGGVSVIAIGDLFQLKPYKIDMYFNHYNMIMDY